MGCPWIGGGIIKYCAAVRGLVVLSIEEMEANCETVNFTSCSTFAARAKIGKPISMSEYYWAFLSKKGSQPEAEIHDNNNNNSDLMAPSKKSKTAP